MKTKAHFLVVDGYSKESRDEFEKVGMTLAHKLYTDMLLRSWPTATYDVYLPSDTGAKEPTDLKSYAAVLWTGCNLTAYHDHDPRVRRQIDLAKRAFADGVPSFGSCWGLQIAACAAGGDVKAHPKGREMGIARKIRLSPAGISHPMYRGKDAVFEAFISHEDEVVRLPDGAQLLASNPFTNIQAFAIKHKAGEFWGVQYHPEYNLFEMAQLTRAREKRLTGMGFFRGPDDFKVYTDNLLALHETPDSKSLRWQLAIDDDVIDEAYRTLEFNNFLEYCVKVKL